MRNTKTFSIIFATGNPVNSCFTKYSRTKLYVLARNQPKKPFWSFWSKILKVSKRAAASPAALYKDMRVIVTQNRDKLNGIVNGKPAIVHCVENATVFLKLRKGNIVATHPVTATDENDFQRTCYPFAPAYALTMTKSQGQTLDKVIVCFDSNKVGPGSAHVALSRVWRKEDLIVITRMLYAHITPVTETYQDML